jgi:PAS domain S-box-containing protein
LFGWPPSEIVGVQSADIKPIPPEDREQAHKFIQRLLSGESILNIKALRDTKDGGKIQVSLDFIPLSGDNGEVAGWKTVAKLAE